MKKAQWTFMVYIAGDNNLDPAALKDIGEMAKVGSSEDLNVIVQLDRAKDRKTRRFFITKDGGYRKDCIEIFDETNTGDPTVLQEFILWGMEKYPASRYALVIWNHGGGWWDEPEKAKRNIAYDDSSDGDSLNNQELQQVLDKIAQIHGKRIDILGMDACLMAMVEVAYQLRDSIKITVGSEEEEPFDGWPYDRVLDILKNKPRVGTATVGRNMVKAYINSYQGKGEDVTQSAFNLYSIGDVVFRLDALSRNLIARLEDEAVFDAIFHARDCSPHFFSGNYVDFYRFVQVFKNRCKNEGLKSKAGDLLQALRPGSKRAIVYQRKLGQRLRYTHGMSIYFPFSTINPKYRDLDFYRDCRWGEFLEKFLNAKNRRSRELDESNGQRDPSRAGIYGPGFAGNPWRNSAGQFTSKSKDEDGNPYT
jgi:hypothetical protein